MSDVARCTLLRQSRAWVAQGDAASRNEGLDLPAPVRMLRQAHDLGLTGATAITCRSDTGCRLDEVQAAHLPAILRVLDDGEQEALKP